MHYMMNIFVFVQGKKDWFEVEVYDVLVGVCIHVEYVHAVLMVKSEQLYCTTCKKTTCDHTKYADQLKSSCDDFRETINQLQAVVQSSGVNNRSKSIQTYFVKKLPFIPNSNISDALKRLPQIDHKTLLLPNVGVACHCGSTAFEELVAYEECDLITLTCLAKVKGILPIYECDYYNLLA